MDRAEKVIERLLGHYEMRHHARSKDPFRSLIRIILSQNTSYQNEAKAFEKLEQEIGVTPQNIADAPLDKIAEAIRPAGMHNLRSKTIKGLTETALQLYEGDLSPIMEKDFDEAREELMRLPGVGQKTADVLLLFDAGKAVIPVDRYISRIAKRLELVQPKAAYDEIRRTLEAASSPERCKDVHVLLIRFGREICRAQRPRCENCFLSDICPYPQRSRSQKEEILL